MPTSLNLRRFNVDDYYRMADAGILDEDSNVELIEGQVVLLHPEGERPAGCPWLFTVEDYDRMADFGILREGERVELIEGEIVEMPPIGSHHAGTVNRLLSLLSRQIPTGDAVIAAQNPVRLSGISNLQPDISVLRFREDFYSDSHPTPAEILLLIEVADTSAAADREVKLPVHARAGIPEVWIVDLSAGKIESYRSPSGEAYVSLRSIRRGEDASLEAFPSIQLKPDDILGPGA